MPQRTQTGKWVIWDTSTGERSERFSVDARELIDRGTHSDVPPKDQPPTPEGEDGGEDGVVRLPGGWRVENTSPGWWKVFNDEGEQVGDARRSKKEALSQVPATHQPGGTASGATREHSPGVPLDAAGSGQG